ncbi:hypothetical protein IMW75_11145 [Pseudomonas gregormendelii]|uniref:SIR2-like domain-containing protein n=1 Tax=Pseudomonas gregormendelii TaxID=1628277 RepID=A0ABS3AGE5_9PSED|nr:hypothetical protein [Pseudomonas gregormendelii]MBN3965834.1 hypothetical protein [Pseudomonas gregormendelii]
MFKYLECQVCYSDLELLNGRHEGGIMSRNLTGLFLGAGASYDAEMPLVWELTAELKSWLTPEKLRKFNLGWTAQGGGHPAEVIDDFISVWDRKDLHYESVLGYLEVQSKRMMHSSQHYHSLYSWLVQIIYYKLYGVHVSSKEVILKSLELYRGIESLYKENRPLWVFSLNHDSIVESIASHFKIPIYSGFSGVRIKLPRRSMDGAIIGSIEMDTLSRATLDEGAMFFPNPAEEGIYLIKIHGALDMFVYNDAGDLLKVVPEADSPSSVLDALRIMNEELIYVDPGTPGGIVRVNNEIAYADFDGQMNFLRRTLLSGAQKFHEHGSQVLPKSLLKHFRSHLNSLDRLVCVGYGFGDQHINECIRNWLAFSPERKLEIVSPEVSAVPAFILHLAPQVKLVKSGATEHLDNVSGIKRSRTSDLEQAVRRAGRKIGPQRRQELMKEFLVSYDSRIQELLTAKIMSIAQTQNLKNMAGLEASIADWRAEIKETQEEFLQRLLDFIVNNGG